MSSQSAHGIRPLPLVIGGAIALASAMGIGRFVYTPILPEMVAALHLTGSEAGLIASANFAGYLIGALIAAGAYFATRRRCWMVTGLALSALTTAAMAASPEFFAFIVLRFVSGVASAFVLVFASSLVLDRLAAAGRSSLSPLYFAGVGIGIASSAAVVAVMVHQQVGWRGEWLVVGAVSALAVIAVALLVPGAEPAKPANAQAQPTKLTLPLIALNVAYCLFGFGYVITATFLVQIVRTTPEIAPLEPYIWIIVGLAAAPSVAIWLALGKRWGVGIAYAVANALQAVGVLASVLWIAAPGAILAAVLLGGTIMGLTALGLIAARRLAPDSAVRLVALMTAVFGVGQIVGPYFAGWLRDLSGSFLWPSVIAAAADLVAAFLVWRFTAPALR